MMLIEWMSSSGAADEWEVLSSHLQYLRREISHITQWYLRATPLSVGAHRENTNGIPAAPCFFFPLTLSFTALHCEANWKALSSLRLVLEWAALRNLSYLLSAGLQQANAPPPPPLPLRAGCLLRAPLADLRPGVAAYADVQQGGTNLSRVQRNQKAPGWTQTWPAASHLVWVNNTSWMACLQSPQQGQKTSLNLSGWLSDVEQMCWNGGNYVTSFSPLSCDHDD